jgi:hypothetical protein
VARLYDARKLDTATRAGGEDGTRTAYERALRQLPTSMPLLVTPVAERVAQAITDAKNL